MKAKRQASIGEESHTVEAWTVALLFITVQIQTTLAIGITGIRASLADLLLPLALAMLWYRRSTPLVALPIGLKRHLALLALTGAWLAVAIIRGRMEIGHWQSWAVANRGLGFLFLVGFFVVGWAGARIVVDCVEIRIVKPFLVTFWVSCAVSATVMVSLSRGWLGLNPVPEAAATSLEQTLGLISGMSRFQGFAVNPNAFGFLAATALVMHLPYVKAERMFPGVVHICCLAITLVALAWSHSRGAWLGAVAGCVFLMLLVRVEYRKLGGALMLALILSGLLWMATDILPLSVTYILTQSATGDFIALSGSSQSIQHRVTMLERSLALWLEAPILGAGIGAFLERQEPTSANPLATIHSTYLWLLSEAGIIGLMLVIAFLASCFVTFLRRIKASDNEEFVAGAAATLVVFAFMALTMEALYQRYLWLILGVATSLAARRS